MLSPRVLVFDSSNLIYRNYHVMMSQPWIEKSADSLCDMMMRSFIKESKNFQPTAVFSLWDFGRPPHREQLCPTYKESRPETDPIIREAREYLHEVLPSLSIVSVGHESAEADDLAHLLSNRFSDHTGRMISTDYDWLLSINPNWEVLSPVSGKLWDYPKLIEDYGPDSTLQVVLLVKAMCGDGSDEIPGIPGIGDSTATVFAQKMVRNEDLGDGVRATLVKESKDIIDLNTSVMSMGWILDNPDIPASIQSDILKTKTSLTQMDVFKFKSKFKNSDLDVWKDLSTKFNYQVLLDLL